VGKTPFLLQFTTPTPSLPFSAFSGTRRPASRPDIARRPCRRSTRSCAATSAPRHAALQR